MESIAVFFVASVLLALVPGPDNLFVLTQSALYGRRAGLLVTLGLCTGLLAHTTLVAIGVAAILKTSPIAFGLLKVLGAVYLLYLAWLAITQSDRGAMGQEVPRRTGGRLYRRGIIMNVTNPKVSLFFLAFLPQFIQQGHGQVVLQVAALGSLFIVATVIVFGSIAILAGSIGMLLQKIPGIQRGLDTLAGIVYVLLAVRLLLSGLPAR